jgi:hypothetical protein
MILNLYLRKKVILTLSIAAIAVIACNKEDDAIGSGPAAIAHFFLNEIEGTELEALKNDREVYAKFITGDLYASKNVDEENIVYRFYEIIDNN